MLAVGDAGHDDKIGIEVEDALEIERCRLADTCDCRGINPVVRKGIVGSADKGTACKLPGTGKGAHTGNNALRIRDRDFAAQIVREGHALRVGSSRRALCIERGCGGRGLAAGRSATRLEASRSVAATAAGRTRRLSFSMERSLFLSISVSMKMQAVCLSG